MKKCQFTATHSLVWPGETEKRDLCAIHLLQVRTIAAAMGVRLYIEQIPIEDLGDGRECAQPAKETP